MNTSDPLRDVLREWEAPEPSPELDARVRGRYRAARKKPLPALAALVLILAAWLLQFHSLPPHRLITRLDATGFQPLPNGAVRVVSMGEIQP